MASPDSHPSTARQVVAFAAIGVAVLATPLAWEAVDRQSAAALQPSYLPALEGPRSRAPFDPGVIDGLERMDPGFVVIGDSMAGRIDEYRLDEISGVPVAPIRYAASGPALWYLALKNWVVPAAIRPRWVVVFFRDTNLTDTLWRIDGPAPDRTDPMALDVEPELNALVAARTQGPWFLAHRLVDRVYDVDRHWRSIEPRLHSTLAGWVAGAGEAESFLGRVNARFELEHLRPMRDADMRAVADRDADFPARVASSVLPHMLQLATDARLQLVFVRVLRRPVDGRPPPQSAALVRYQADLRAYVEARGGLLIDDRDHPAMATLRYQDGDHIAREDRAYYTELFYDTITRLAR